jgi:5-deoxy-D-glucuronate isomerase
VQRVYTDDRSFDETLAVRDGESCSSPGATTRSQHPRATTSSRLHIR